MATRNELEQALINADAAGDIEAARMLASAIQSGGFDQAEEKPQEYLLPGGMKPQNEAQKQYAKDLAKSKSSDLTTAETIASDPGYRMVKGAADIPLGIAQYTGEKVVDPLLQAVGYDKTGLGYPGDWVTKQIDIIKALKESGLKKRGEKVGGIDPYEIGGGVASGAGVMKGTQAVANAIMKSRVPAMFEAAKVSGLPAVGQNMLTGASGGGVYASMMPVSSQQAEEMGGYDKAKLMQQGTGVLAGGAIPAVAAPFQWAGKTFMNQVVRPFSERGREKDVQDLMVKLLGEQKGKVAAALAADNPGLTTAQVLAKYSRETGDDIGNALVNLERSLSKKAGTGIPLQEQYATQREGRRATLKDISNIDTYQDDILKMSNKDLPKIFQQESDDIAMFAPAKTGTPAMLRQQEQTAMIPETKLPKDALKRAIKIRAQQTGPMYEKAGEEVISGFPKELAQRPAIQSAISKAREGFINAGKYWPSKKGDKLTVANVQRIKKQISEMVTDKESGLAPTEREEMTAVANAITDFLRKQSGKFAEADDLYRELSKPVNQMKIGRQLESSAFPVTEAEAPAAFLKKLDKEGKLTKQATGFKTTLADTMDPPQLQSINKVAESYRNMLKQKEMAKTTQDVLPMLKEGFEAEVPHVLSRPVVITNAILKVVGKSHSDEYNKLATELMQNPQRLAKLIQERSTEGDLARKIYSDILPIITAQTAGRQQ